jgi:hypothetical protein
MRPIAIAGVSSRQRRAVNDDVSAVAGMSEAIFLHIDRPAVDIEPADRSGTEQAFMDRERNERVSLASV